MLVGKRFCGGCGQAMPVAVTPPDEASTGCSQCGAVLAPGKRFCKQCGCAVGAPVAAVRPSPFPEPTNVAESAPSPVVPFCLQCGEALAPGKRFCKLCGWAADVPTEAAGTAADIPSGMAAEYIPTVELEVPHTEPLAQEYLPVSEWKPAEETGSPSQASSVPTPAFAVPPLAVYRPKTKIGLAVGLAAAVLAAAGGGWAWHVHRPASREAASAVQSRQQSIMQSPVQATTAAAPDATPEPAKPLAGSPADAVAGTHRILPQPAPDQDAIASIPQQSSSQIAGGNPTAPTPVFPKPVVPSAGQLSAQPAQLRSGVLHYQGPPVPRGGTVVFDNLPKTRLKFVFDHAAWQLIIKPNPDGTKRVILISQMQGYQTNCDLSWEVVE